MREYISPNVDVFEGQLSIIVAGGKSAGSCKTDCGG